MSPSPSLRTFTGLFLVPLLVVLLCVGIFLGFGWMSHDRRQLRDYVDEMKSAWGPRRAQAAYELSRALVVDPGALADDPATRAELRELFRLSGAGDSRRYLALVLGYTRDREAVPLLLEAAKADDNESRIYVLIALGASGDPRAETVLASALQDADAGIRKTAAHGLGLLGRASALPALEGALHDPVIDVRWNAALAIARLGGRQGRETLFGMLDRSLVSQVPDITPAQTEAAMITAIAALGMSGAEESVPFLEVLATEDPSLEVRQAALQALEALDSKEVP